MQSEASPIVSFEDEDLIVVDENDVVLDYRTKAVCHDGPGLLHRAFSVFLFNPRGELLLQQRSEQKRLWPLYWSNTCCSHPRRGESTEEAASRRTFEELNVGGPLRYAYKFIYQASFGAAGGEHELCWVFVGRLAGEVRYNSNEIAATRFVAPEAMDRALRQDADSYTPWLHLEWPRLRREFWTLVEQLP